MSDNEQIAGSLLTPDERTMATLAHVLQLVGGWIAPLVILLVKRNSRFVSFHALQVLLFQGLYFIVSMLMMAVFFPFMIAGIVFHQPVAQQNPLPPTFVVLFLVIWLVMMGWWVFVLVAAIVYGIKAGRGEWAEYPMLGSIARRILKIGPQGELSS